MTEGKYEILDERPVYGSNGITDDGGIITGKFYQVHFSYGNYREVQRYFFSINDDHETKLQQALTHYVNEWIKVDNDKVL